MLRTFLNSYKGLSTILFSLLFINVLFYYNANDYVSLFKDQKREDASGFSYKLAKKFSYFHYYTGHFPLASLNNDLKFSEEEAYHEIEENGSDLIMEYKHWSRLGENARIWAFLPNSILSSSPENPSIKLFNCLVFVISMCLLFFSFWHLEKALHGLILVILVNFTPFFIYEIYLNQNIFGLLASVFFIILSLNISALFKKKKLSVYLLTTIISGLIIGFFSEFRNEISIVLIPLILIGFLSKKQPYLRRFSLVIVCILSFLGSKKLIRDHFEQKFETTAALVEQQGGHVYNGAKIAGHKFWHPVFCGLGDFDKKYGFEWNDKVAYKYATPILQEKYGMDIKYSDKYHLDNYYDEDDLYYVKFDEIDLYEEVVKEKVIHQIKEDPFWYITILFKRVVRTLSITLPIPYIGWFLFYVCFYFIKNRQWTYLKLLIVSLPLSATSILIYSGDGATYNSVFVYFVLLSLVVIIEQKLKVETIKD